MNILLTVAYVGTDFCGFQIQKDKRTVQGELESALKQLYGKDIRLTASGRTDVGVHAVAQAVNFFAPKDIPLNNVIKGLNCFLPSQIRVRSARQVSDDFNARKNAIKKTYKYRFYFADNDDPFLQDRAIRICKNIDFELMEQAAKLFEGTHDFNAFRCYGSSAKTTVRTVFGCDLVKNLVSGGKQDSSLQNLDFCQYDTATLTITANGFLYKMVRLIVGALVKVGTQKLSLSQIQSLLDSGEFYPSKIPVSSGGLYLYSVDYGCA